MIDADAPATVDRAHITEKPVDLLEVAVQVAPPGGLVLDPFAGSGTTGMAAVQQGRRFVGFEMVPAIAASARERIAAAAGDWHEVAGTDAAPTLFGGGS